MQALMPHNCAIQSAFLSRWQSSFSSVTPLKDGNILVYLNAVSHKLLISEFHTLAIYSLLYAPRLPKYAQICPKTMMVAMFQHTGAILEGTGCNLGACSNEQMTCYVLRFKKTKLCVTCQALTVTIYDFHHLNRLLFYHVLKVKYIFGSEFL